jgi:hypothetical protein
MPRTSTLMPVYILLLCPILVTVLIWMPLSDEGKILVNAGDKICEKDVTRGSSGGTPMNMISVHL